MEEAKDRKEKQRKRLHVALGASDEPFRRECEERGITPSAEIRRLIEDSLSKPNVRKRCVFKSRPEPDETRLRREIRFSESEFEAGTKLAKHLGTNIQGMLISLVRCAVEAKPIFSGQEVNKLAAASLQLGAVGRNFNQLVRRLNSDIEPLPNDYENAIKALESVFKEIREVIKLNGALITAAEGRWELVQAGVLK
jgi:hypothetical protein